MSSPPDRKILRRPSLLRWHEANAEANRAELATGLLAASSMIAPKFLYDALGSRLFAAITELPEYYPTRTEAAIFKAQQAVIAEVIGTGRTLVDLGAGNCEKAASLFPALRPARYVAVDISTDYLAAALDYLQFRHPELAILGIGMDFSAEFSLPVDVGSESPLVFYPGSSIGNFTPSAAEAFLRRVRTATAGGGLLIGVDLVKPLTILEPAYDDALGVTAAFNRNMLTVVNHLLEADFKVADFRHIAFFNAAASRIEMHLEAVRDVVVCWPGATRRFNQGERIHTENSYKYEIEDFAALLQRAGYGQTRYWTDARGWFALFWAEA